MDAPNYAEERGLTLPRINMLLEQGQRRRFIEAKSLALAARAGASNEDIEKLYRLPAEKVKGDGTAPATRDLEPWWPEDDFDPDDPDAP